MALFDLRNWRAVSERKTVDRNMNVRLGFLIDLEP